MEPYYPTMHALQKSKKNYVMSKDLSIIMCGCVKVEEFITYSASHWFRTYSLSLTTEYRSLALLAVYAFFFVFVFSLKESKRARPRSPATCCRDWWQRSKPRPNHKPQLHLFCRRKDLTPVWSSASDATRVSSLCINWMRKRLPTKSFNSHHSTREELRYS